jgi:predicted ArsR family transcriptional regulator
MSTGSLVESIADPIRLGAVRTLADAGSASLAEIAARAGVHPNTARPHLVELERDGVVVRTHLRRAGRGRPTVIYRLADGLPPPPGGTVALAELLAALVHRLDPDPEVVAELGGHWGRYLAGRPGGRRDLRGVVRILEHLGFDVELHGEDLRLRGCPCPLVSPERPELVCTLARAVADGALRSSDERRRVVSATHDPRRRSCRLELAGAG